MTPQPCKGKRVSPPRNKQSVIIVQVLKPSFLRAALLIPDIAQLVTEQITIA
jgi:hypothetical protein